MYKWIMIVIAWSMSSFAFAEEPKPKPEASPPPVVAGEEVDVTKVTEKYWAQGKDSELGVVQNRKYSNEHRIELDLIGGTVSTDPFLSVHHFGGTLGYHFTQY